MNAPRIAGPAALLALLLLGACESDAAKLAKEIADARGECTEEKLKAGDEACVQMMQKYASMGTSAIESYIGAVKSLDQAIRRMPAASFDTAGIGHALTPASEGGGAAGATGVRASRGSGARGTLYDDPWPEEPYGPGYDPRDPRRRDDTGTRYAEPRYSDPGYSDPRGRAPAYPDARYGEPRYADPRDPYPGAPDPRYDGTGRGGYGPGPTAPRSRPGGAYDDRAPARPPAATPGRGLLLPPAERLDRPWLRDTERTGQDDPWDRGGGYDENLRMGRPDDYLPSRPFPADSLDPESAYRARARRSGGY